jgi:hypothetical protein
VGQSPTPCKRPWGFAPPPQSLFEKSNAKTFTSEKLTLFGGRTATLNQTPGEADRKVFDPLFSKSGQGVGQRPTISYKSIFLELEPFFAIEKKVQNPN